MHRHFAIILVLLSAAAFAGNEPFFAPGVVTAVPSKSQETPDNHIATKAECDSKKGEWHEGDGYRYCVVPYPDAWKLCKNSNDCSGHCIWPLDGNGADGKPLKAGHGVCQLDDSQDDCGRPQFENGKITYFKCD